MRQILLWHTGGAMPNAAIVGFTAPLRYMLVTDAVLRRLTAAELGAVARHELAHVRRRHMFWRLAMLLLVVSWWSQIERLSSLIAPTFAAFSAQSLAAILPSLVILCFLIFALGWYSRLLEHDADYDACLDADGRMDPLMAIDLRTALLKVCGRDAGLGHWLHPSLDRRLSFLNCAVLNPASGHRFRARLKWIAVAIVGLHLLAAAVAVL